MSKREFRNKLPLNLQFFAEPAGESSEGTNGAEQSATKTPTIDELIERVASLETANAQKDADILKWKNASDKASSQAADYKRQLTARMSAQEQADQAKLDAENAMKAELEKLRAEVAKTNATKRYMKLGMTEELAEATAIAEISGDMDGVSKNYEAHIKSVKDAEYQRFLAERPEINAGHGDSDDDPAVAFAKTLGSDRTATKGASANILKNYI